ncbi:RNA-binding domain-containing protein [Candidatus Electrothrix sp.]|uniref:RNA-binding domain-containing protein n=1 Tax=Candidatus Electrothrix sp. TaxID=2170559 RepID=UPI004056ACA7
MPYNQDDIRQLIQQGENHAVEFKLSQVHADSLAKEMTAFANSYGGVVLLGVDDKGNIQGLSKDRDWEEWVANISRNNVIPPIMSAYQEVDIDDGKVGVITVEKGLERPYQTSRSLFLVRVGSTSRTATQGELMRLFQQAGLFHFDLTAVQNTGLKELNLTKIADYFQRWDVDITDEEDLETLLANTDILTHDGQVTVAGLLLFGLQPQRFLHNSSIIFAHYLGKKADSELLDRQVIEGTLDYQVDACLTVIKHNLKNPSVIIEGKRESTIVQYLDKVFRELLVNACVHRNYAISGSRIRILQFNDRLEFISPGRLPNTVTIEKLRSGVSYAVNPVIVKFMENLRYIDKLGRGLPMVYRETVQLGRQPIFEEFGEEFRVTLPL